MPTCPHGAQWDKFLPEWEELFSGLPASTFNYPSCFCWPPSNFDRKNIAEVRQMVLEAQLERERWEVEQVRKNLEKKLPGKSGGDGSDDKDDSAGRWYFITFTTSPARNDPHELLKRTQKVIKSKMVEPIHWCYSLELTESGLPHTHIRLFAKKYFDYKKIINFNDGFRAECKKEKWNTAKYTLKKDVTEEYLSAHGINCWFWNSPDYFDATGQPRPA